MSTFVFLYQCKIDKNQTNQAINIRLKKDPERINPLTFPNAVAREVYQYIHLPLADFNAESLELQPLMIKELPIEQKIDTGAYKGGIYFDFEIEPQAKWDNGTPITGEDYLFTIKSILLPLTNCDKWRDLVKNISDVQIDKNNIKRFRVIFKQDYMLALETACTVEIFPRYFYDSLNVLSRFAIQDFNVDNETKLKSDSLLVSFSQAFNGNEYSRNKICGAGPYTFKSWTTDQNIILEKKKEYWGAASNKAALQQGPEQMIFHIVPDDLTALTQLKSGALDLVNEVSASDFKEVSEDEVYKTKFNFFQPTLTKQYYISINNGDVILEDKNVRKALALLIDVEQLIQILENGLGVRTVGPINPLKKTYNKSLIPVKFDAAKALELLTAAGWKDSNGDGTLDKAIRGKTTELVLDILISGQETGKKISLLLQESAAKLGIKINIIEKDFKLIRAEHIKTRKYQLVPSVISQDPQTWDDLSKWHSENDTPSGSNDMSYKNPETDALIDKILQTKSDEERISLYHKVQEKIADDQAAIFLYVPKEKIIINKRWAGKASNKRPGYMANTFKLEKQAVSSDN